MGKEGNRGLVRATPLLLVSCVGADSARPPPALAGEGQGGGTQKDSRLRTPSPPLQPKSDLSDFGQSICGRTRVNPSSAVNGGGSRPSARRGQRVCGAIERTVEWLSSALKRPATRPARRWSRDPRKGLAAFPRTACPRQHRPLPPSAAWCPSGRLA